MDTNLINMVDRLNMHGIRELLQMNERGTIGEKLTSSDLLIAMTRGRDREKREEEARKHGRY